MIVVTGYASLDHVAVLDGSPRPGRTTTILDRPENAWPRLGGAPAYVASALVLNGVSDVCPVTWIGADPGGDTFRAQLAERGIEAAGLAIVAGARTPVSILAYEPDGGCICLYHPGIPSDLTLTEEQQALVAAANWVCVTIGPIEVTRAVLRALRPEARLAWIVKNDPRALPPDLARQLAGRADLICCSRAERAFVDSALSANPRRGRILIETQGGEGATLIRDGQATSVPTNPIAVGDPTGAGDTFAGGVLASLAGGETDPTAILQAGHRAAAALLAGRRTLEMESA